MDCVNIRQYYCDYCDKKISMREWVFNKFQCHVCNIDCCKMCVIEDMWTYYCPSCYIKE